MSLVEAYHSQVVIVGRASWDIGLGEEEEGGTAADYSHDMPADNLGLQESVDIDFHKIQVADLDYQNC